MVTQLGQVLSLLLYLLWKREGAGHPNKSRGLPLQAGRCQVPEGQGQPAVEATALVYSAGGVGLCQLESPDKIQDTVKYELWINNFLA